MTKRPIVWALGLAVVVAVSLPLVFHAQPRAPQPAAATLAAPLPAASPAPQHHHPRIEAAIRHLEEAKHELEAAPEEFRGHRVKAIEHVNQALGEAHKALEVGP